MRVEFNAMRILLVLVVFQKGSRASDCYQCNSRKDDDCTINKVHPKYLSTCSKPHSYCRKSVYIYYFTGSKEYHVVRECARWQNAGEECYRGRYTRDSYQLVCECKGAACNPASTSVSNTILLYFLTSWLCTAT